MRAATWLARGFVAAAGLQVTGLFLDRRILPYCGTLALTALWAVAAASPAAPGERRWPRRAALTGLALLAATAGLVDARTDGYGWPAEFTDVPRGPGLLEAGLLASAAAALAVAVLGRAGRLLRWRHIPAALYALVVLVVAGVSVLDPQAAPWQAPPDRAARGAALALPVLGVVLVCLATSAALASRELSRRAAAGLFPILVLATGALSAANDNDLAVAHTDPAALAEWDRHAFVTWTDTYDPASLTAASPIYPNPRIGSSPLTGSAYRMVTTPAPEPEEPADIPAVPGPPSWPPNLWEGDIDWARSMPAFRAELLLIGLVLLVTSLFRIDARDGTPLLRPHARP